MSHAEEHHQISYIEFAASDVAKAKEFYCKVFGWSFKDWGPDYAAFTGAGVKGGFAKSNPAGGESGALAVLYSADLKATEAAVLAAGGKIVKPTFEFPGGRRFHFADGVGNVLAVWSE